MNSVFSLHALAAWKMLRQRKIRCCRAAEKPAIRAACSKDQRSNSRNAGQNALSLQIASMSGSANCSTNGGFWEGKYGFSKVRNEPKIT
ncbi:hypothetical protein C1J03_24625 (plasmid) [Sulfitobacter sp. SK012]|nr:hypothetical protein C1J03_24625 [Sulfitobacter sp. SK012]